MAYIGNAPADQALEIGTGVVGTTEIEDLSILNADVSASAALVFSKMANLTVGRALISDGSGDVSVSDVTSTEVGYLDGVSSALQTQLGAKAALASPTFTGNPIAPTQSAGNNSTRIATTAYADTAAANLVDSAPATLNTLNELAAALGDDASFSTTVTNSIALKAPIASPTFTGTITGDLTGDVTGDVSGSSATVTGATQSAITSVGTLTSLAVGDATSQAMGFQIKGAGTTSNMSIVRDSGKIIEMGAGGSATYIGYQTSLEIGTIDAVNFGSYSKKFDINSSGNATFTGQCQASSFLTGDLILKSPTNNGHYTIWEEEEYLAIRNEMTGKKYKFVLEEIE